MLHRLPYPAALACLVLACSDRPGPVEPNVAAAPVRQQSGPPIPVDPSPILDPLLEAICGFPVVAANDGKVKNIFLPDGRLLATSPGLHVTLINLDNGRSARVNATGPITFDFGDQPDGELLITWNGRSVWAFPEAQPGFQFVVLIGHFTMRLGPNGEVLQPLQGDGQIMDACALVA